MLFALLLAIACPGGTTPKQLPSDDGHSLPAGCADAKGALHGKSETRDKSGALQAEGEWDRGVQTGISTTWYGPGRPAAA